tara:strand:+ start:1574 stop:2374 length:801 start_codon:yes stop_codon:yes gene_type:complete
MFATLDKLLLERFILGQKKYGLIKNLDKKSYMNSLSLLNKIKWIIAKEIKVNFLIGQKLKGFDRELVEMIEPVYVNLVEINHILKEQNKILYKLNFFSMVYSRLFNNAYFERTVNDFEAYYGQEVKLNELFLEKDILNLLPKKYRLDKKKLRDSLKLVKKLQVEVHKLGKSVGNRRLVKLHSDKALELISKVQKTELYGFIKQDVQFVKTKVGYMVKNPKENKVAYALGTFYIVSPLTFEATGVVLFFRYLGKYSVSKVRKIRKKA